MQKLKLWLSQYFGFNNREINGLLVLSIVLVAVLLIVFTIPFWYPAPIYEVRIEQYFMEQVPAPSNRPVSNTSESATRINNQTFDPNTADEAELESHGIASYLAARIVKYREAGGVFRQKKDLLKIYDFPEGLYNQLEDKIALPANYATKSSPKQSATYETKPDDSAHAQSNASIAEPVLLTVNINTDDTLAWQALRGIGPVLSARIIKYKNVLGGFTHFGQLGEVYGLSAEVLEENKKLIQLDPAFEPRKLSLSESDIKQLAAHPYISYGLAKILKAYEQQHAPLDSIGQLRNIKVLEEEKYAEIAPYLCL